MSKIKKLSPLEAQKIAAGEVVERPANVVKELVENALDAGATAITLYIEDGGKKLIRVVDNGCGMAEDDARLCFEHHATSKITSITDLDTLATFGFRGEALSSIASISAITLVTKEHPTLAGIKMHLQAGTIQKVEPISAQQGTDITIQNLFFNVPARKKFLKKQETEWNHIKNLFHAFCFSHDAIHFKLHHEGKLIYNCPPVDSAGKRLTQLWDESIVRHLITLQSVAPINSLTISGVISDHQFFRYDRSLIYCFVNNRWVKNHQLGTALIKGYHNVLAPGRFPAAALFITIDPRELDINTHPRKEEVHFVHPQQVTSLLQEQVRLTLQEHVSKQIQKTVSFMPAPARHIMPTSLSPIHNSYPSMAVTPQPTITNFASHPALSTPLVQEQTTPIHTQSTISDCAATTIIGQLHKTYILLEHEQGLMMIDQHAAHERILYEQFVNNKNVATIQLLFPQIIPLSSTDIILITPHLELLKKNGIEIEPFGDDQLIIQSTPIYLKNVNLTELVKLFIGWLIEQKSSDYNITAKLHIHMACKAAVKAGDTLTHEHMKQLIEDLNTVENRFSCPHGRPTMWLIRTDEIEKRFKRDYR